jgi:hypothetical protein
MRGKGRAGVTTDDLAHDVTYLETISRAVAETSAKLMADVVDLKARLEKLPAIVTDVRIGPGEYHACPRDLAPLQKLVEIVQAGGMVLIEDVGKNVYRLVGYDAGQDKAIIVQLRGESGRQVIPKAAKWVHGYMIYNKLGA